MKKKTLSYWACCALFTVSTLSFYQCKKSEVAATGTLTDSSKTLARAVTTFVHPGILNTTATLNYIRTQANDQSSSRYADYNASVVAYVDSHTIPTSFPATVVAKSSGTTLTETQIKTDSELAYALALRWAKTGDAQWATKAKAILNGWASNFQQYTIESGSNANQPDLEAAWVAPTFAAAAEIIRYYTINGQGAGWSQGEIDTFSGFLNKLKVYINATPSYNNNWNVSAAYAKMALGVFFNSTSVYQNGADALKAIMPSVIQSDGTMPELCVREDCVHFQYSLTGLTYGAEIARIQGDNTIYPFNGNRISAGYDYMRRAYNNQYASCASCSSAPTFPGVEIANRYYHTGNTGSLRAINAPNKVPNDNTFLGFTTYTHNNVPQ